MSDTDQALRDVVRGAGITYVGLFMQLLIAFFAQVIAARHLSLDGFGGLTTGTAILNVGCVVAVLGLGKGLARYLPRLEESGRRPLVRRAVAITLAVAILVGTTISLTAETIANSIFGDPIVTPSIAIFGAVIPFAAAL
jgi:O-antigen/teichoic acid export membrane protein